MKLVSVKLPLLAICLTLMGAAKSCGDDKPSTSSEDLKAPQDLSQYFKDKPPPPPPAPKSAKIESDALEKDLAPEHLELRLDKDTVMVGMKFSPRVIALYPDFSKRDVTGSSSFALSDSSLAHATQEGDLSFQADAVGELEITASFQGVQAKSGISIRETTLLGITIEPKVAVVGAIQGFTATARFSDGSSLDVTKQVTWTTSDERIAVPKEQGAFDIRRKGQVTVGVVYQGVVASTLVDARLLEIEKLEITAPSTTLMFGTSMQLEAKATYANGTEGDVTGSIDWSSADPVRATVGNTLDDKGLVSALVGGPVTIVASWDGVQGKIDLIINTVTFESIAIEPATEDIPLGLSRPLKLIGSFGDGTTQDVTDEAIWTSSLPFIASVSNDPATAGKVEALAVGQTEIKAVYGTQSATLDVNVTEAALTEIHVTSDAASATCGVQKPNFTAEGVYSNGVTEDITEDVTWSVEHPALATVSNDPGGKGKVTTTLAGNTTVVATIVEPVLGQTVVGSQSLLINAPVLEGYVLEASQDSVPVGLQIQMKAFGSYSCAMDPPEDFTSAVTWATDDPLAEISNDAGSQGLIVTSGTPPSPVTITVTADDGDGMTADAVIEVRPKEVLSLDVFAFDDKVDVGSTLQIHARATYSDGTTDMMTDTDSFPGYSITWYSDDDGVAQVDDGTNKGLLSAVSEGETAITGQLTTPQGTIFPDVVDVTVRSPCTTGTRQGYYCWFHGMLGESCLDVCARIGATYIDADVHTTGSAGSGGSCGAVMGALGLGSLAAGNDNQTAPSGEGVGCATFSFLGIDGPRRYTSPATSAGASGANIKRVCSCSQ